MLLDSAPGDLVSEVILEVKKEKGRRLPIHGVHRWWSRRFSAVYRFILGAYLLENEKRVLEAINHPKLMREKAVRKVYFEPFAGGGTGLAEAALAGFNVYGVDINPVAVMATKASLSIVSKGIPDNFAQTCEKIISKAQSELREIWEFNGKLISYIFVSRGRIPTWLSVIGEKKIVLCPHCYKIFETAEKNNLEIICPFCGEELEVTSKPIASLPPNAPEIVSKWRAFALELRWYSNKKWEKGYSSIVDYNLLRWIENTIEKTRNLSKKLKVFFEEIPNFGETNRLKRADIKSALDIYAPHQLVSFAVYSEIVKDLVRDNDEYELFAVAASETSKCCNLLAKWYPPLGECTPAGGVKALWVPEYTAITNPLASSGLKPLARGTLASALRAQIRASHYLERIGGTSKVSTTVILGDALDVPFPRKIDLIGLDPPYGKFGSYASLSIPHYYILKAFSNLAIFNSYNLKTIEAKELSSRKKDFQNKWKVIIEKIARSTHQNSRVVLMFTSTTVELWKNILEPFKICNFIPVAVYWVLGEGPSNLTASKVKGINLVVFKKTNTDEMNELIHIVQEEVIREAKRVFKLNEDLEREVNSKLLTALKQVFDIVSTY